MIEYWYSAFNHKSMPSHEGHGLGFGIINPKLRIAAMDCSFRKVEVRIKGNLVPILNLNLQLVGEMREGFEIS